ncbi:tyrosine-type recombinase/integrase [Streptomyces longhuiensis]|uniref:tyrosine-type recombinase/integrase n=1 Tax=Streptomyces longhuiensis TaxID=2880933 RepID=UPI001D0A7C63|nr:site-specific integrase [Streptomyces longhuiensis]UDM03306.1 site-specific integrase [Streptomyces longhuiensis]
MVPWPPQLPVSGVGAGADAGSEDRSTLEQGSAPRAAAAALPPRGWAPRPEIVRAVPGGQRVLSPQALTRSAVLPVPFAPPLTGAVLPAPPQFEARETLLTDWVHRWWLTLDIGPNTASHYRSLLKNHILPRWGAMPLHLIAPSDVTVWLKSLQQRYARATTTSIGKLFALVMAAAVIERLLPDNPVRIPRQRGRERQGEDQLWAAEHEVITLARRVTHLADANQGLLVITAAYTGMRWGELAALRRPAHNPQAATLTIHPNAGNLLEVDGRHSYGPPKTAASVRTVTLPPFLNTLLQQDLAHHDREHLFTSTKGKLLRRSTFSRRVWAPASRGTTLTDGTAWPALKPGLTFHNLRHTHKTWLIEDNIPEVAQARRLGHTLKGIADVYAHVADSVDARLLDALEARWQRSLTHHALAPTAAAQDALQ